MNMNTQKIDYAQIQKIAREETRRHAPKELPPLEKIAWAFPIEGRERAYYHRGGYINRIPNTQEGNAMVQLMTFKNFKNVLKYLAEGKTHFHGCIPTHILPCGDADDGAYMVYPYINQKDLEKEGKTGNGFFWKTLPGELVKAVLKVEKTGRGSFVDEKGESIERVGNTAYVNENLTRQYIRNLKEAYEMGTDHLLSIANSLHLANNYPQLVLDKNPENWQKGQEFQKGFYVDGSPGLIAGRVLENKGKKIKSKVWNIGEENENIIHNDKISDFKGYGEHGLLWRLAPAEGRK